MRREEKLPHTPEASSQARHQLDRWFGDELPSEELDSAKLICTELVNNAVVHGEGKIHLCAELDQDRLLLEVTDEGSGFEHTVREGQFDQLSGRGLMIVEAESSRWGIHQGTTHVWAELERAGPRLGRRAKPD